MMLTVLMWLYRSPTGHRKYDPSHIRLFMRQFSLNYNGPHQFVCITDFSPSAFKGMDIQLLPMPKAVEGLENNFRRLWTFSDEAAEWLPGRIFMSDIDVMITGDLTEYLNRPEPLVLMTDPTQPGPNYKYSPPCLLTMGVRPDIWDEFLNPGSLEAMRRYYIDECGQKRVTGSDMAWLSYYFKDTPVSTFNQYRARNLGKRMPDDALIVHFSGKSKPWNRIREEYFA